jgi:hypothetical protein
MGMLIRLPPGGVERRDRVDDVEVLRRVQRPLRIGIADDEDVPHPVGQRRPGGLSGRGLKR